MKKKPLVLILAMVLLIAVMGVLVACDPKHTTHSYGEWAITKAATCVAEGSRERKCTAEDCTEKEVEVIAIDAKAHVWSEGISDPLSNCSDTGIMTYTCTLDAKHDKKTESIAIDPTKHTWDLGAITTDPTCTTEGVKTFTCITNKDHTITEAVAIVDDNHVWEDNGTVVAATCSADGSTTYKCTANADHASKVDVIATDPTAHALGTPVTAPSTCTAQGTITTPCTLNTDASHNTVTTIAIDPTAHNYSTEDTGKPATCTEAGNKEFKCTLTATHTPKTEVIPALGHNDADGICPVCTEPTAKGLVNAINKFLTANNMDTLLSAYSTDAKIALTLNVNAISSNNPALGDTDLSGLMTELKNLINDMFATSIYANADISLAGHQIYDNVNGINNTALKEFIVEFANGGFLTLSKMTEINGKYVYKGFDLVINAGEFKFASSLSIELEGDEVQKVIDLAGTIEKHIMMVTMTPTEITAMYGDTVVIPAGETSVQVITLEAPDALLNAISKVLGEAAKDMTLDEVKAKFNNVSVGVLLNMMSILNVDDILGSGADGINSIIRTINSNANLINKVLSKLTIKIGDMNLFKTDAKFNPTAGNNEWAKFVNAITAMLTEDAKNSTPGQFMTNGIDQDITTNYALPLTIDINVAGFEATETVVVVLHLPFEKVFHNHILDDVTTTLATCIAPGSIVRKCSHAGCTESTTEILPIDPNAHKLDGISCSLCGKLISEGFVNEINSFLKSNGMNGLLSAYNKDGAIALVLDVDAISSSDPAMGDANLDGLMTKLFAYIDEMFAKYDTTEIVLAGATVYDGSLLSDGMKKALVAIANGGFVKLSNMTEVNGTYVFDAPSLTITADKNTLNTTLSIELSGSDVERVKALAGTIAEHIAMDTMTPDEINALYGNKIVITGETSVQVITLEAPDALLNAISKVLGEAANDITLDEVKAKFNNVTVGTLLALMETLNIDDILGSGTDGINSIIKTINSNANLINKVLSKLNIKIGNMNLFKADAKFVPGTSDSEWTNFIIGIKNMLSAETLATTPGNFETKVINNSTNYAIPLTIDINVAGFTATETIVVVLHMPFEKVFHNPTFADWTLDTAATCTTVGREVQTCTTCLKKKI